MKNPIRRNRNIGTSKQGHGQDNELTVPLSWYAERYSQDLLGNFTKVEKQLAGRTLTFFIDENSGGYVHSCSVSDVMEIFKNIPWPDWEGMETIVFRQPSKKERILNPVWGRMYYHTTIGRPTGNPLAEGPAIFLEAQPEGGKLVWSTSQNPEGMKELRRLEEDGHIITRKRKKYTIQTSRESVRRTQLYRTIIHEVGHWVDYLEKVLRPEFEGIESYDAL